jgi:4-amino-4-deoxy-L-arabinose transferase-like glycosyltransferase
MQQLTPSQRCLYESLIKIFIAGILASLVLSIIVLSSVPPVSRDALTHHLAVPEMYLRHGGIYEIPSLEFSYYPMNLDLLYLIPLYFGNDIAPKFIHFSFALFTAGLIFWYSKKRINSLYALFGVLLFLSLPIIIKLSVTAYVDLGLVFFSTASLLLIFKWREKGFPPRYLLLAGICCGLATGTKYNGLIVLVLLTLSVAIITVRPEGFQDKIKRGREASRFYNALPAAKSAALFLLTALIVFSPWMIRNTIWTNNPVYPLFDRFFNHQNPAEDLQSHDIFTYRRLAFGESMAETLAVPVRVFFEGRDNNPRFFDGQLNPYLLLLPIFAFASLRKNTSIIKSEKMILLAFSFFFMLFAFFMRDLRIRYIAPIIPPLIILSIYGWFEILQHIRAIKSRVTGRAVYSAAILFLMLFLFQNGKYLYNQFDGIDPLPYLKGEVSRNAYIERHRPEYAAYLVINRRLPDNAKILAFFLGNRGYYCEKPILFYPEGFKRVFNRKQMDEKLMGDLENYGITHLLIRSDLFVGLLKRAGSMEKINLIKLVKEKSKLIFSKNGYALFELY